jgi:hypothetical protein
MNDFYASRKDDPESNPVPVTMWGSGKKLAVSEQVLSRNQICQFLDLGLLSLQKGEKYLFVVYKLYNLWCIYSTLNRLCS